MDQVGPRRSGPSVTLCVPCTSAGYVADRASDPLVPVVRDQRRSPRIVAQLTRFVRTPLRLADTTALLPSRRSVGCAWLTTGPARRHLLACELDGRIRSARLRGQLRGKTRHRV